MCIVNTFLDNSFSCPADPSTISSSWCRQYITVLGKPFKHSGSSSSCLSGPLPIALTIGTLFHLYPSLHGLVGASSSSVNNKDFIARIIIHLCRLEQAWGIHQKSATEEPPYISKKQTWASLCDDSSRVNPFKWIVLNYMITDFHVNKYCEG